MIKVRSKVNLIYIVLGMALMILGIAISMQFRSILREKAAKSAGTYRVDNLKLTLDAAIKERESLEKKIDEADKKITSLEKEVGQKGRGSEILANELEKIKIQAMLVDVKGPGLVITMDDADVRKGEYINILDTIIHDLDVVEVVNELRASGAQALAINGERLAGTSEMICAGPTISVNRSKTATPFVISAIGNVEKMQAFLNRTGPDSIIKRLQTRKIRIDIKKTDNIVIPKYKGSMMEEINE